MPSGLLWAKANIGATSPEQSGLFFSWGNSPGHAEGSGYDFSQAVYNETPGAAINTDLTLANDMARQSLGTPWRLPSDAEFQELYDNCTVEWTTLRGVNGILFTSNANGETLFLPASGYYHGTVHDEIGTFGGYWSSTYVSAQEARSLSFTDSSVERGDFSRRQGFSVRPCIKI